MREDEANAIVRRLVENYRDAYEGGRLLATFSRVRFIPPLLDLCGTAHNDAIIGLFQRINFWFRSLEKLDSVWDFQTIMNAARAVYELTIDIRILCINHEDPTLIEKFHVFPDVTRYDAARKFIDAVDKHGDVGKDHGGVDARRSIVNDPRIVAEFEAAINKHWGGKAPPHWTGMDLVARINKYLPPGNVVDYRNMYSEFSWHVHSGSASLAGLSEDAIPFLYCQGHAFLREYFGHAGLFVGISTGLFRIHPELRQELEETCGRARTMLDRHMDP
jgi:hypothetical protein